MQQLIQRKSECIVTVPLPPSCKPVTYHLLCKQRGAFPLFDIYLVPLAGRKTILGTYYQDTGQYIPHTPLYPQTHSLIRKLINHDTGLSVTYQPYCKICGRKLTHPQAIKHGACIKHQRASGEPTHSCNTARPATEVQHADKN